MSTAEVAAMWMEKVDQSEVGNQVTTKYLDTVMKLKRNLFCDADADCLATTCAAAQTAAATPHAR